MIYEIKATRPEILKFIKSKDTVEIMDLMNEFGYSRGYAYLKLLRLEKAGLVEKLGIRPGAYCLTNEGTRRLEHYEQRQRRA